VCIIALEILSIISTTFSQTFEKFNDFSRKALTSVSMDDDIAMFILQLISLQVPGSPNNNILHINAPMK
jgi:hypothetical protein